MARRDLRVPAAVLAVALVFVAGLLAAAMTRGGAAPAGAAPARSAPHADEIDARFRQGVLMLHAKKYDYAVTAFHQVLKHAPRMPEAHVNMGFALLGLERPAEARDFFESATALRPRQANAYYGMAMALEAQGDGRGAIGAMRAYLHLTDAADPYRRKAEAALWEWEAASTR